VIGKEGETRERSGFVSYLVEPKRRQVTAEMIQELEQAGLLESAEVAKKLAP
jgi:hypothetical protein